MKMKRAIATTLTLALALLALTACKSDETPPETLPPATESSPAPNQGITPDTSDLGAVPYSEPDPPTEYEQFLEDNDVTLTNYDVQYDLANSGGKYFYFDDFGIAELDDYYNSGYSGTESEFFVMAVTPGIANLSSTTPFKQGDYMDRWYVYADREKFSGLFDKMKDFKADGKEIGVSFVCQIDTQYNSGNEMTATLVAHDFHPAGANVGYVTWS
jgi:hypothetical protein